jgi:hypothetical protein
MNFFEELKQYLETTPQDKILEDWSKYLKSDNVGPTMEEFLQNMEFHNANSITERFSRQTYQPHYTVKSREPLSVSIIANKEYSPKYPSGFFMVK